MVQSMKCTAKTVSRITLVNPCRLPSASRLQNNTLVRPFGILVQPPSSHGSASLLNLPVAPPKYDTADVNEDGTLNGWFLGEAPGTENQDEMPGGYSKALWRRSMLVFGGLCGLFGYVWYTAPPTDAQIWAKEEVLNKEKFRAPKPKLPEFLN